MAKQNKKKHKTQNPAQCLTGTCAWPEEMMVEASKEALRPVDTSTLPSSPGSSLGTCTRGVTTCNGCPSCPWMLATTVWYTGSGTVIIPETGYEPETLTGTVWGDEESCV